MRSCCRLFFLCILLAAILLPGCSLLEKQKLPTPPQHQDEVSLWLSSLAGLSGTEQGRRAEVIWNSPSASSALRDRALSIAASRPGKQGFAARTELNRIYTSAAQAQRSAWEAQYWRDLDSMDSDSLKTLASKVSSSQERRFPWNLVMLKAARRGLLPDSSSVLNRLSDPLLYADPTLVGLSAATASSDGTVYAALVLPQSGKASALGQQIAAGALAAADTLKAEGRSVEIRIIDSSQADWKQQLQSLSPQFTVVGGPLLSSNIDAVKNASTSRALFTFTSSLPAGEEGVHTWRFFTSSQDQVRTLLDTAESLGIHSFGVFTPDDTYGKRMSGLFLQEATKRGHTVTTGSYTANNLSAWPKEAGSFVKMQVGSQRGSIPVATADFDAILLTDSWKNMDMLVSSLHYCGAQNKLMMGTALWEQNLTSGSRNNAAAFALTIYPAVWNPAAGERSAVFSKAVAARGSKADDWTVLGFDFVQMAAALSVHPGWTPDSLNKSLASIKVDWAGAPFSWDISGKASRQLFVLTPAAVGSIPVNTSALRERLQQESSAPASSEVNSPASLDQLVDSITKN